MLTFRRPSALGAAVLLGAALVAGAWGCRTASGPCPVGTLTVTPNPGTIVTPTAGPLATITVPPDPATMVVNGTQQFVATGRDADGNVVSISPNWSVVNGGGAINGSGFLHSGAGGVTSS